jgi:hypothetical protein
VALVRAAGGDVVDAANIPIEPVGHKGAFIAAVDTGIRKQVVNLVAGMLAEDRGG